MTQKIIKIQGARVHNLKNVDVDIPRDKMVVITGLSGSGKSSLAFDTLYAEGQRRYVESLSAYARQFIGVMDKPEVESIEGLSPAISIDQKSTTHNPRSTVGTVTEIYDYLRLLFARVGTPHCYKCGKKVKKYSVDEIVNKISEKYLKQEMIILAPVIRDKKGEHKNILENIEKAGYHRIRFDNRIYTLEEVREMEVEKKKKHNVEVITDKLRITDDHEDLARLNEAVENALDLSGGLITVFDPDKKQEKTFSRDFACPDCDINLPELEPRNFSFNSPHGACPECSGLGTKLEVDPDLILNPKLTIAQGGIKPLAHNITGGQTWLLRLLGTVAEEHGFDLNTPLNQLSSKQLNVILYGSKNKEYNVEYQEDDVSEEMITNFRGIIPHLERKYFQTESEYLKKEIGKYMKVLKCPACQGKRLKPEMLAVKIQGLSIYDIANKNISQAREFFEGLEESKQLSAKDKKISSQIIKEIRSRLHFLLNVGLDYLTLDRPANTLSGGEAQRIRLATQIGSALTGVLYILDEPSIGLHQRDNSKLINTLQQLRDLGNTV
ncbi:MAG TPA: excinuclease ABC subunit UvrA, partial [Patescibacteria group bacterium]|nr:excinuclease ABC subunit UvrA [Patescibacteria group bacterium]